MPPKEVWIAFASTNGRVIVVRETFEDADRGGQAWAKENGTTFSLRRYELRSEYENPPPPCRSFAFCPYCGEALPKPD